MPADEINKRIKAKTDSIAARVFRKGFEITLDSGRAVRMDGLEQRVTYSDVLEGWPNKARNDRRIDELIRRYSCSDEKPYILYAPRDVIHIEADEMRHFNRTSCPQPELLPYITCFARFYSDKPTRDFKYSDMSYISMIWFQDDWAMPIAREVIERLKSFDWDSLAYDGED